jgi:hypothetical protein
MNQLGAYDPGRYDTLTTAAVIDELHHVAGKLLLRGDLRTLLARREIGGLLHRFAVLHPHNRKKFETVAETLLGLSYSEGRRHIQLWVSWPRCFQTLEGLRHEAERRGKPFIVPGLRRLLAMAGVTSSRAGPAVVEPPAPPVPEPLPSDTEALKRMVLSLQAELRDKRAEVVVLRADLRYARWQRRVAEKEAAALRRQIRQMPNPRRGPDG